MIDEEEFERRINHWFSLIMDAVHGNVRATLCQGKPFTPEDLDTPEFAQAMRQVAQYQATYLPDAVLAHFLDPILPKNHPQQASRLEFLLQQALLQRTAQTKASQVIERLRRPG
jgi:hypothetical protein